MSGPPDTGTLGNPSLGGLTDETPIVVHGPVEGSVGLVRPSAAVAEARAAAAATTAPGTPPATVTPAFEPREYHGEQAVAAGWARANSLDALRGLFLVLMTLGFTIHGSFFPDWMYHRQFPPPGAFVDVAGISWRDLAYAAFIFTMAAALPITLSRRIERGQTEFAILFAVLRRFVLLFLFALLIGHSNTYFIGYTQEARIVAVTGFVVMFVAFTRRRPDWSETWYRLINRAGWVAAIAFLALSPLVWGGAFSLERRDDIIAGLAFAALSGSIVWYVTRANAGARMAILAATVALYLGAQSDGWVRDWWWSSPVPWLLTPSSLSLLTVVIPGTIAGDLLLRWMRIEPTARRSHRSSHVKLVALSMLCILTVPLVVAGLYNRWTLPTTQLVGTICIAGVFLTLRPAGEAERLVRNLFYWSALWLLLGMFLEPAEGGIRKVPETLSYYFTVTGLTMLLLVALVVLVDVLGRASWVRTLIDIGHNPMLAYVLYTVFLNSLLELIPPLRGLLRATPGESMVRSLIMVAAVVLIVQAFTRRRIYWRT